jgi:hypothetical protein
MRALTFGQKSPLRHENRPGVCSAASDTYNARVRRFRHRVLFDLAEEVLMS